MFQRVSAIALGLVLIAPAAIAAERIGLVKRLDGAASILRGGDEIPAMLNAEVRRDDLLRTGADGAIGILFADDTRFALGASSEALLDEFLYDPQNDAVGMTVDVLRGAAAFVTGRIGQFSPQSVSVNTPVATIGIRGTRFVVSSFSAVGEAVDPVTTPQFYEFWPLLSESETDIVLLEDEDGGVGEVVATSAGGSAVLNERNSAVRISGGGGVVGALEMGVANEDAVDALFGDAIEHVPTVADRFAVRFPSGQSTLNAEARRVLTQALAVAETRLSTDISVVGHTDRAGEDGENLGLSEARATAVREALQAAGLLEVRIETTFHGEREPIVQTADGVAEPRNRRVEIVVR